MQETAILDIRTLALNRVEYLGSGFAHLLPDASGSGVRSTPKNVHLTNWNSKKWYCIVIRFLLQSMQHQVAHIATQIDAARLMVYNSARMKDASQNVVKEAAMAKYYCGEVRISMLILFYRQHVFARGS